MNNKALNYMRYMLYLFGLLTVALPVQAASFDCAKAGTKVEHLICNNPEISKLDEKLATSYKAALLNQTKAESVRQTQKQWMKERNNCVDVSCVRQHYQTRLETLAKGEHASNETGNHKSSQVRSKFRYAFCDKSKPGLECEGQTGKGYSVCEAYFSYLQTLSSPPSCEAPIPPGFKQPDWQEMDITQHLDLAYQAEGYFLKGFGGYKQPDFETWKRNFLQEIKAGKINPLMQKARVMPNDKGEVTILAYTRDRDACHKSFAWEKRNKVQIDKLPANTPAWKIAKMFPSYSDPYWRKQGEVHFILSDDSSHVLHEIVGDASRAQMELLLYGGKPYLVEVLEPLEQIYPTNSGGSYKELINSPITIFAFDPRYPDSRPNLDLNHYLVNRRCQFLPY